MTAADTPLRLVAWRGYDDRTAAARFLERHGIELDVAYVDADEDAIERAARAGPGAFDLIALDNRYLPILVENGLVSPLDLERVPNAADSFDAFLRRVRIDGATWAAPFIWGGHPMAYNARFVDEPPTSWLDVLKPEYEGRIVMLDGVIHQIIVWGRVLGYPNPTHIRTDELGRPIDLAVSVKQRSRARLVGWDELPVALASGEAWLATAGWEAVSRFAAELGGDVRTTHPAEGAYPWLDSWAVARGAPNEEAALRVDRLDALARGAGGRVVVAPLRHCQPPRGRRARSRGDGARPARPHRGALRGRALRRAAAPARDRRVRDARRLARGVGASPRGMSATAYRVRLVVWRGYDDREAAAPFLEAHGIELDVAYVDADEEGIHLLEREGPDSFDFIAIDNRYLPLMLARHLLAPIDVGRLANAVDVFETFARFGRDDDGTTWSVPYIWGRQPMPCRPEHVSPPPTSWLDVLRPELRWKVAMLDGAINQIVIWARVLGYPDPVRLTREQLDASVDLAVRVKRDAGARLVEWDEIPVVLARGEAWIATAGWEAVRRFAAELGADVGLSYPKEEAYPWLDTWALVRGAPNEEAAYAWVDWMIGPQAQRIVTRNLPCGTVNRRAVEVLDAEVHDVFPHAEIDALMDAYYVGLPPEEAVDGVTTLADWYDSWEAVRTA